MERSAKMGDFAPSYSASKAALNALTRMVADAARGSNVLVNAVDPGWVRTQMGGSAAPRSIEQGTDTIVLVRVLEPESLRQRITEEVQGMLQNHREG